VRTVPAIWATALLAGAFGQTLVSDASGGAPVSRLSAPAPFVTTALTTTASSEVRRYEYVFDDGTVSVYDMDQGQALVKTIPLPQTATTGIRGVTVAPAAHLLFVSYGGDGGRNGNGSVLAYDLVSEKVLWDVKLSTGIDSGAVSPDGKRLYMPTGENASSGIWNILDTTNGAVIGTIQGGAGAHNTIASNDGRYVYLGGRNHNFLDVYDTQTGIVREVGPLVGGVRPFTVNGSNTIAFTTATEFDGFQVSSITTGKVLFTLSFGPVPNGFPYSAPSHGVSLSPDEKQLYVIDAVHGEVQVYDVSKVSQGVAPTQIRAIHVAGLSGTESPCAYDCAQDGWLQHSLDGRFVYVGDSGEVIDTASGNVLTNLATLANTRKSLEIDWAGGVPVATSGRVGVGYVTEAAGQASGGGRGPAIIRGLTISPKAFRSTRSVSTIGHGGASGGATVRYSDSEPATTRFTVLAPRPGIKTAKRGCGKPARGSSVSRARRCTRYVTMGGFAHRDRRGRNSLRLTGWVGGRKLAPGQYRLAAVPAFDGRAGARSTAAFRVLR
jgi:DNA-binding beta-propeller fold protein YncE